MPHLGKTHYPCQLFKTSLSTEQRARWVAVLDAHDPDRIFDGGKVKLGDMFDLTPQVAASGISMESDSGTDHAQTTFETMQIPLLAKSGDGRL